MSYLPRQKPQEWGKEVLLQQGKAQVVWKALSTYEGALGVFD